ncbi:MAG: class I SAM-dependent methyltransferase [Promethearchaeota archaeon]
MKKNPIIHPSVENIYDKYAEDYNGDFAPSTFNTGRAGLSFCNDITMFYLKKYLPSNKSLLIVDIGAGDGYWVEKLIELGYYNFLLTDLSQNMLKEAKKRFNKFVAADKNLKIQYTKADIRDLNSIESNSFDFVMSLFDPVSYCLDPPKAMKELARIAKPGANIIVSLDTKYRRVPELIEAKQIDKVEELLKSNISYDFGHAQYNLTWEELEQDFKQARLEVLETIGAPVFMHQVKREILTELEKNSLIHKRMLEIELKNCTNKSLINFAGHLMMIGRKK